MAFWMYCDCGGQMHPALGEHITGRYRSPASFDKLAYFRIPFLAQIKIRHATEFLERPDFRDFG